MCQRLEPHLWNRQIVDEQFFRQVDRMFRGTGFRVITLKYGETLRAAFDQPGGKYVRAVRSSESFLASPHRQRDDGSTGSVRARSLKRWLDSVDNSMYSVLTYKGGAAFRAQLLQGAKVVLVFRVENAFD